MASRFTPLTPRVGAKIVAHKEDLLSPDFAANCMAALERHGVLLFPQLHLSDEEQVAFSNMLGKVIPQGPMRPDGTREIVFKITLDPKENPSAAEYLKATIHWHIDGIFDDTPPPKATMLTGRRLSTIGGQTEFCNTYAAYDDLPEIERTRCDSLRVVHTLVAANLATNPDSSPEELKRWRERAPPKEHPLVWRHETGRKSLVLGMTTDHVVGLSADESRAYIAKLSAHATRAENVYRHEWQVGDLLMWDNTGVMHRVSPYPPDSGRLMHRTVLYGVESIN
jgi:alpha-ketoglutarate-dependent taurine dioxygenase